MELREIIGAQIRKFRIVNDWSIEHLAELIEVSPQFLGAVERGERYLSVENLVKVSKALLVPIDYLIMRDEPSETSRYTEIKLILEDLNDKKYDFIIKTIKGIKTNLDSLD